jgi:hypothetical protein
MPPVLVGLMVARRLRGRLRDPVAASMLSRISSRAGIEFPLEVRPIIIRFTTAALVGLTLSSVAALASRPAYPLLVSRDGLRVYGPPIRPNVPCPHLLALPSGFLATGRRAVALAMPPFAARLNENGRDPIVSVRRHAFDPIAGGCGRTAWRRSFVAFVRLPHVCCASLSQHSFFVGRIASGWVLWAEIQ